LPMTRTLYIVCGPTAVGKTDFSIQLAKILGADIISADSRQIYREIPIGTAQPTPQELAQVRHHFIAQKSVTENYNAGMFARDALAVIENIFKTHSAAVVCGGTGLYINALVYGFDDVPSSSEKIRNRLRKELNDNGIESLQQQLQKLDPEHYATTDLQNHQRLIRALEVCLISGRPYSSFRKGKRVKHNFNVEWIGLDMPRQDLYDRINQRVDSMLEAGLLNEVRAVLHSRNCNALQTLGYREMFEFMDGKISIEEAAENIKTNTRRFAKRQLTWFRREENMKWLVNEDQRTEMLESISGSSNV